MKGKYGTDLLTIRKEEKSGEKEGGGKRKEKQRQRELV